MRKLSILIALVVCSSVTSSAQTSDDYKKTEFYIGYSSGQNAETSHGINASGVYNLTRYIGAKGDFSALYNSRQYSVNGSLPDFTATFRTEQARYNISGGVQIKDNANSGRFKPFAHVMIGVAHRRDKTSFIQCSPTANCPVFASGEFKDTAFSTIIGGGLDLRLKDRWQLRLFQVDYNPVRSPFGGTERNIRLGAGIVF